MSNILTDWRLALVAELETNLQSGTFTVLSGRRDGESRDRKLACVFFPGMSAEGSDVSLANPQMVIRAWLPRSKMPKVKVPADPEPIEQLAVDLMTVLEPVSTTLLPGRLYFWVSAVVLDEDDWGVQATLAAFTGNPAILPA